MRRTEFIIYVASLFAVVALAVDIILPAFDQINESFKLPEENDRQAIISLYLIGLGVSQLLFGALADYYGRKIVLNIALFGFFLSALGSTYSSDYEVFFLYRFINGFFSGGPVVIALTLIRDKYRGKAMAAIMSFTVSIFIVIPIIAPILGQILLIWFKWQVLFYTLACYSLLLLIWTIVRLKERKKVQAKQNFFKSAIYRYYIVIKNIKSMLLITTSGILTGLMFAYISVSQQIFTKVYGVGVFYPLCFGGIAISIVISSQINARTVMKIGILKIIDKAMIYIFGINFLYFIFSWITTINLVGYILIQFFILFLLGFLRPNLQSKALESFGKMAGSAAAVNGFIIYAGGGIIGQLIANSYNGNNLSLAAGNLLAVSASLLLLCTYHHLIKHESD